MSVFTLNNHLMHEYDHVVCGHATGWQGGLFYLSGGAFAALTAWLEQQHNDIAKFTRLRGQAALQLQQWVGLVRLPDGTTLEILPKTHQHGDNPMQSRAVLLRMLAATDTTFRIAGLADLDPAVMPLFELFLRHTLLAFAKAIRQGLPHSYLTVSQEQSFLRGRLDFAKQIRQAPTRAHLLHVRYDEYQPNRPETRLLRSSLEKILQLTRDASTKHLAKQSLLALETIPRSENIPKDFAAWRLERGYGHFAQLEPLCQMVLHDLNPIVGGAAVRAVGLLFDMNKLYEAYVAWWLRRQHPDWQIRTQVQDQWLGRMAGKPVFRLKPDLHITLPDGEVVIADTKWKRLGLKSGYGVAQADVYQMLAYSVQHQAGHPNKRLWLLYPRAAGVPEQLANIELPEGRVLEIHQVVL